MGYILSVVIPTKNRLKYLKGCLTVINEMNRSDVEVIVQDNSDNHEEVHGFITSLCNPNIKYYYDGRKLSQTENSDVAFSHITGEYAVYIGDDDSICKSLIDLAYAMKKYEIESATYGISTFNWPDLIDAVNDTFAFRYTKTEKCNVQVVDSNKILIESLKNGMQDIAQLPRVYHGIVSSKLLNRIFANTNGTYFPGPSPDMANATSCAILTQNQIDINIPMIVSGFGKTSAGGMGKRKLHRGSLKGNFQLRDDVEENWDKKIPKRWMQSTIWPNSAMTALKELDKIEYCKYLNYGIVASETILHDKSSAKSIFSCRLSPQEIGCMVLHTIKRIVLRFTRGKKNTNDVFLFEKMTLEEATRLQNAENDRFNIMQEIDIALSE